MEQKLFHKTLVFERKYKANTERLYSVLSEKSSRERWAKPHETIDMKYETFDFKTGGKEVSFCGPSNDLRYKAIVNYLEVIENQRIIYSETVSENGLTLGHSLVTMELIENGEGSILMVTDQIISIGNDNFIEGNSIGYNASLDNIAKEFD